MLLPGPSSPNATKILSCQYSCFLYAGLDEKKKKRKGKEKSLPIYYDKASNVLGRRQVAVTARHDEPDHALQTNPEHQGVARA